MTSAVRIRQAAQLLGVSEDTLRRWADAGRVAITKDDAGRLAIAGPALAALSRELAAGAADLTGAPVMQQSIRNRFTGIVTAVERDRLVATVEIQAGPHRFVSLITREAADELQLEVGVVATATVKATNVSVERPAPP